MLFPDKRLTVIPVQTLHPADEALKYLQLFESVAFTLGTFTPKLGRMTSEQAEEIAYCVQQGRELFIAAKAGTALTMPVTLYYGALNLAKALIISRQGGLFLRNLPGKHGLSNNVQNLVVIEDLWCRPNESGTFSRLNEIISDQGVAFVHGSGGGSFCKYSSSETSKLYGVQFGLKEIFARLPELRVKYFLTYNERPRSYRGTTHFYPDASQIRYSVGQPDELLPFDQSLLHRDFSVARRSSATVLKDKVTGNVYSVVDVHAEASGGYPLIPQYVSQTGHPYFVAELGELTLHELSAYYMGLYMLSMLSRYRPELWGRTLARRGEASTAASITEDFMISSLAKVPMLMLVLLSDIFYDFGESVFRLFRSGLV